MKKLWLAILALAILSPLGIIVPALFGAGSAWGEWSLEEVKERVGYVPEGMRTLETLWKAPIPDYSIPLLGESMGRLSVGYILSALVGILLVVVLVYGMGRYMINGRNDDS